MYWFIGVFSFDNEIALLLYNRKEFGILFVKFFWTKKHFFWTKKDYKWNKFGGLFLVLKEAFTNKQVDLFIIINNNFFDINDCELL